jgi:hypothetical protein
LKGRRATCPLDVVVLGLNGGVMSEQLIHTKVEPHTMRSGPTRTSRTKATTQSQGDRPSPPVRSISRSAGSNTSGRRARRANDCQRRASCVFRGLRAADRVFQRCCRRLRAGRRWQIIEFASFLLRPSATNARAPFLLGGIRLRLPPVGMTRSLISRTGVTSIPSCANNSRSRRSVCGFASAEPKATKPMIFSRLQSPERGAGVRSRALSPSGRRRVRTR